MSAAYHSGANTAAASGCGGVADGCGNVLAKVESFRERGISVEKPMGRLDYAPREAEEISE